ncbi:PAS domain S-box protein [Cohnella sp. JJ-181]|uniref:PAS domain S-box protein n=1 Tax=Cohnella rhizoplanae TaxID=2974897 RepID=UPI0022FFB6E4|nr:PAS domain S-box protein [Cohnella sp. JJ-181]CAI6081590.1 Adaptive-response sensory-kinase SasA [Cohnella sp. JJ-181]
MSIKLKLTLFLSILVAAILMLNLSITYFWSKSGMQEDVTGRMEIISKQIGESIKSYEDALGRLERAQEEKLLAASIAIQSSLDPDIDNVTNEELVALTEKLQLEGISLWIKTPNDIVVKKSSEPGEINLGSNTMDYWYRAFQQLFARVPVNVGFGRAMPNFWSGPFNFATSDPDLILKWGDYYDGTTNYMINPFMRGDVFVNFKDSIGTEKLIKQLLHDNPDIVEITGIDPAFFGKAPIIKIKKGKPVYNLDVRDIVFGTYSYKDDADVEYVNTAITTGKTVTATSNSGGKSLLKNYIPIHGDRDYIVTVSFDRSAISGELNRQLLLNVVIGLVLLGATVLTSYWLSGLMIRPVQQILHKVNAVAEGSFDEPLPVVSNDELGLLSDRVNTMASNLSTYTNRLRDTAEELRSTKQYLESFVHHSSDAIHVADPGGNLMQLNAAFEKMYGWSAAEALGRSLPEVPTEHRAEFDRILRKVVKGGAVADYETTRYRKDGSQIDVSITISPVRNERGEVVGIASISRNITERKHTEEMLRRSEKLSMVGQLAAGVAHEIRNPLTTLRGFVQLQQQSGSISPVHLDTMLSELDRINFIVGEFLVLSKPQAVRYQLVDIRSIMRETVSLLEAQAIMNNVQLELRQAQDLPLLNGEPNQLKQVFLNVLKNGMEAMPDGGTVRIGIATEPDDASESDAAKGGSGMLEAAATREPPEDGELEDDRNGEYERSRQSEKGSILIVIEDEGFGISENELKHLGEPFYSNKASGHGLGLMVSQQIIAGHRGSIRYKSALGRGTRVEIRLPL